MLLLLLLFDQLLDSSCMIVDDEWYDYYDNYELVVDDEKERVLIQRWNRVRFLQDFIIIIVVVEYVVVGY